MVVAEAHVKTILLSTASGSSFKLGGMAPKRKYNLAGVEDAAKDAAKAGKEKHNKAHSTDFELNCRL